MTIDQFHTPASAKGFPGNARAVSWGSSSRAGFAQSQMSDLLAVLTLAACLLAVFATWSVPLGSSGYPRAEQLAGKLLKVQYDPSVRVNVPTAFNLWIHEPGGQKVTLSIAPSPVVRIDSLSPRPASWTQDKNGQVLVFDSPGQGGLDVSFSDLPAGMGPRDMKVTVVVGGESRATLTLRQWVMP